MRRVRTILILAAVAVGLWAGTSARADGPSGITLQPVPPAAQAPGQASVILSARLMNGNAPVGGVTVTFYVVTNVFGERLMKVGETLTDATGTASVVYEPTWEGDHTAVSRFGGNGDYAATQATFHFDATNAVSGFEGASFGLEPVRQWLPVAVGLAVLLVWASLGFALLSTAMSIRAAGAGAAIKPVTMAALRPQRPAALGRPLLVLVAVLALAAVPTMWLLGRPGSPDQVSFSTDHVQMTGDGTPGTQDSQGSTGAAVPMTATLVRSVPTMNFDDGGQLTPDSVGTPADVAVTARRPRILDANKGRIVTVTPDGKLALVLEAGRAGEVSLKGAQAMTVHDGKLYVAVSQGGEIVVVDSAGGIVGAIKPVLPVGQYPLTAAGLAVTDSGEIWLSDSANHRVLLLTEQGEFQRVIGDGTPSAGTQGFNAPAGLALDGDGNLYVADTMNRVVKKYSPMGVFLQSIGEGRLRLPTAAAVDGMGHVFVSDEEAAAVSVFAPGGDYLGSIGGGRLQAPHSVKIDGDLLYVMDRLAGLFVFRPDDAQASSP